RWSLHRAAGASVVGPLAPSGARPTRVRNSSSVSMTCASTLRALQPSHGLGASQSVTASTSAVNGAALRLQAVSGSVRWAGVMGVLMAAPGVIAAAAADGHDVTDPAGAGLVIFRQPQRLHGRPATLRPWPSAR